MAMIRLRLSMGMCSDQMDVLITCKVQPMPRAVRLCSALLCVTRKESGDADDGTVRAELRNGFYSI